MQIVKAPSFVTDRQQWPKHLQTTTRISRPVHS
jgi:hypothetical protein